MYALVYGDNYLLRQDADWQGYIHVMTNPDMLGLLQVGMTSRKSTMRAEELNSAGVPSRCQVQYFAQFDNMKRAEQIAHQKLKKYHHNKKFFRIDIAKAILAIESVDIPFTKHYSKPENDARVAVEKWKRAADQEKLKIKMEKELAKRIELKRLEAEKKKEQRHGLLLKIRNYIVIWSILILPPAIGLFAEKYDFTSFLYTAIAISIVLILIRDTGSPTLKVAWRCFGISAYVAFCMVALLKNPDKPIWLPITIASVVIAFLSICLFVMADFLGD